MEHLFIALALVVHFIVGWRTGQWVRDNGRHVLWYGDRTSATVVKRYWTRRVASDRCHRLNLIAEAHGSTQKFWLD